MADDLGEFGAEGGAEAVVEAGPDLVGSRRYLYLEAMAKIVVIKNEPECRRKETFSDETASTSRIGMNGRHLSTKLEKETE